MKMIVILLILSSHSKMVADVVKEIEKEGTQMLIQAEQRSFHGIKI